MIDDILDTVVHGDALEVLKTLPDACIDAIVCDPPSSINFMNKSWDSDKGGRTQWVSWLASIMSEAKRCLRPGGHCLVWSLPRTSHWTGNALEDAGFEIRDLIYNLVSGDTLLLNFLQSLNDEQQHAFIQVLDAQREPSGILHINGSGFPKSLDISKAIEKLSGIKRDLVPRDRIDGKKTGFASSGFVSGVSSSSLQRSNEPMTPNSAKWSGYGTHLKPSVENWWLVRKPLAASSIAENVLQYGTGAINVDATRINHNEQCRTMKAQDSIDSIYQQSGRYEDTLELKPNGRFPSHLLITHTPSCIQVGTKRVQANGPAHKENETKAYSPFFDGLQINSTIAYRDEDGMETVTAWECPDFCPVRILDLQSGMRPNGYRANPSTNKTTWFGSNDGSHIEGERGYKDIGGASRYFQQFPALDDIPPYIYAGKASRRDRNEGLEDLPAQEMQNQAGDMRRCRKCGKWYPKPMRIEKRPNSTCTCEEPDFEIVNPKPAQNIHPTVKNTSLMKYLVRLITPPNGIILDCFAGSGSTLVAAIHEGFHFIGIEKEEEYVEIARKRIQHAISTSGIIHQTPDMPLVPTAPTQVRKTHNTPHSSQLTLWNMEGEAV